MTAPGFDRLVLVGGLVVDLVLRVRELPGDGDDVHASAAHAEVGAGFAMLATARRHGLRAAYAGRHGDGPFGTAVRSALATEQVDSLLPQVTGADSGFRTAFTGPGSTRMSVTNAGVEAALDSDGLATWPVRARDAVYVHGRDLARGKSGAAIARWVRALPADVPVVFDPGSWLDQISWEVQERVLRRCDMLTLSAAAVRKLVGTQRPAAAWRALPEYAPRARTAVFRHGPDGCWVATDGSRPPVEVPAPPVDAPSGPVADDVHTGVLLADLAAGRPATVAALRGNVAVALLPAAGSTPVYPEPGAVERFLSTRWQPS